MALRADDVDLGRDRDLVVRSQSGDDGAFEDLYRRYFDRLYRFCLRRVHDPHEAEELAQETFTRAYGALPKLAGERRFYPWLSVIASRLCVDEFRRRARSEPAAVIDLGIGEGGQERVLQELDALMLARAMTRLTPRHRDVLRLREHEGWSYQHIAEHMGVNLGTVEALLHRARRALKREFDIVSGTEAVPVVMGGGIVARALRRLGNLRDRVAGWEIGWTPLLGNAMAAAVVVVGSSIGAAPVGSAAPTADIRTTSLVSASDAPTASVGTGLSGRHHGDHGGHAHAQAGGFPGRGPTEVARGSLLYLHLPDDDTEDDGRERTNDNPLTKTIDDLNVGADPNAVVDDSKETADGWVEWTTEK